MEQFIQGSDINFTILTLTISNKNIGWYYYHYVFTDFFQVKNAKNKVKIHVRRAADRGYS